MECGPILKTDVERETTGLELSMLMSHACHIIIQMWVIIETLDLRKNILE